MDKFNKQVIDRVVEELKKRNIEQKELILACKKVGMPISQPDISKIYSAKKSINIYQLTAVCKVLNKPMEFFVMEEDRQRKDFCDPRGAQALVDSGSEVETYKGCFHFYYLSTALGEDKILHGILVIDEKCGYYELGLTLDTGTKDRQGETIIKEYTGRILVSSALGGAYLIFKSHAIGEVSMICIRHRNYSVKDMECRIGLVLTISAGEAKEPTAHRCLLIRNELNKDILEEMRPWLRMVSKRICINKDKLEKILTEVASKYPDCQDEIEKIRRTPSVDEVELYVDTMKNQLSMKKEEFSYLLSLLYGAANTSENYNVSQFDDVQFYEKLKTVQAFEVKECWGLQLEADPPLVQENTPEKGGGISGEE